ncbi:MAG: glycogen/starch synthase, partial [Rikenellaceae bacterium]
MSDSKNGLDYLFEVSWEVCNKVGGIHTVLATKAKTVVSAIGDNYIVIGPDLMRDGGVNAEFVEDKELLRNWRMSLSNDGIRAKIGRWKVQGSPIAVLVDYTTLFATKDEVLKEMWNEYGVDSLTGEWDYIESILFGRAAGMVIKSFADHFCSPTAKIAAHFHEWMTASGGLFLHTHSPYVATLFTTHATVTGRCIAGNGLPLYKNMGEYNSDELARQFNVMAKHSIEKAAAKNLDAFLTVSDLTADECRIMLGRDVDIVTPNGFEDDFVWSAAILTKKRKAARTKMISVAETLLDYKFNHEPLIIGTSGRYEYRNKGIDLFLESLKALAANPTLDREILAYITVPAGDKGARKDLMAKLEDSSVELDMGVNR